MSETPQSDRLSEETRTEVERLDHRVKIGLLVVSGLTVLLLIGSALGENVFARWRQVRGGYRAFLDDQANDDFGRSIAESFAVEVDQNVLVDLGRTDRCTTCHTGIDDPRMAAAPQPYKTHPGRYLEIHEAATLGCTICHEGQGRATTVADAHGVAPFWDFPMHEQPYMKSGCGKCHSHSDLFGAARLIDGADAVDQGPTHSTLALERGWRLIEEHGCLGCHLLDGKGGNLGPEITRVGDKTHHEFSFAHMPGHDHDGVRRVTAWLEEHFLDPAAVSPGSQMPKLDISHEDARALTAVMLSLRSGAALAPAASAATAARSSAARAQRARAPLGAGAGSALAAGAGSPDITQPTGGQLYGKYCSSCHGDDGGPDALPGIRTPSLSNDDMLAVADDTYLRRVIASGRGGTYMPGWGERAGGLTAAEIDRIIDYMRAWEFDPATTAEVSAAIGDARTGRSYYQGLCANCHGTRGEGGIGITLNTPTFLGIASDRFLAETIIHGRPGTAMPSWKSLSAQAVSDIITYIRQWQPEAPSFRDVEAARSSTKRARLIEDGRHWYRFYCQTCHDEDGGGGIGPAIGNDDFLRVVDDNYLYRAIVEGRPGTGMPAWRQLRSEQVASILTYVRSLQSSKSFRPERPVPTGDYLAGEVHYRVSCRQCHGERGGGGSGPQLTNPVFLSSVSDAQLFQWIGHGRRGTAMKGFLPEEQGLTSLTTDQIGDVIAYLRFVGKGSDVPLRRVGAGDAAMGAELYLGQCASCHGTDGEGASGPQLANRTFLRSASDGFLAATIVLGRDGTPMRSMVHGLQGLGQVEPSRVQDLVAHMRQWERPGVELRPRRSVEMTNRSIGDGRELYATYCGSCHGPTGRSLKDGVDYYAPALNNRDFLRAASDGFLLATIARGRRGTPMRPFGEGAGGIVELDWRQISDIVSFMRSWQGGSVAAHGTGPPVATRGTGPPVAAHGTGPPVAAHGTGPPVAAPGTGPPVAAHGTGPPVAAHGTGPPVAAPGTSPAVVADAGTPSAQPSGGTVR